MLSSKFYDDVSNFLKSHIEKADLSKVKNFFDIHSEIDQEIRRSILETVIIKRLKNICNNAIKNDKSTSESNRNDLNLMFRLDKSLGNQIYYLYVNALNYELEGNEILSKICARKAYNIDPNDLDVCLLLLGYISSKDDDYHEMYNKISIYLDKKLPKGSLQRKTLLQLQINYSEEFGRNIDKDDILRKIPKGSMNNIPYVLSTMHILNNISYYKKMISFGKEAIKFHPNDCELLKLLSTAYARDDQMSNAESLLLNAYSIDPYDYQTIVLLGSIYSCTGRLEEAVKYYDMLDIVNIGSLSLDYFMIILKSYHGLKMNEKAEKYLKEIRKRFGDVYDAVLCEIESDFFTQNNENEKALKYLGKIKKEDQSSRILTKMAILDLKKCTKGHRDILSNLLNKILESHNYQNDGLIGRIYYDLEDYDNALIYFNKSIESDPSMYYILESFIHNIELKQYNKLPKTNKSIESILDSFESKSKNKISIPKVTDHSVHKLWWDGYPKENSRVYGWIDRNSKDIKNLAPNLLKRADDLLEKGRFVKNLKGESGMKMCKESNNKVKIKFLGVQAIGDIRIYGEKILREDGDSMFVFNKVKYKHR